MASDDLEPTPRGRACRGDARRGAPLTLHGSRTFTKRDLGDCMAFVIERDIPLSKLITHRWSIEDATEAFSVFDSQRAGKCMLALHGPG